jgi:hypothetical protein
MTDEDFAIWAMKSGINEDVIEQVTLYAASPEDMKEAYDAMEPPPFIHTLDDIVAMTSSDALGTLPLTQGFIIVGSCFNGDPIAVDVANDQGSVWYINHETMHGSTLRASAIRVATDLSGLINGILEDGNFPLDHFSASSR